MGSAAARVLLPGVLGRQDRRLISAVRQRWECASLPK